MPNKLLTAWLIWQRSSFCKVCFYHPWAFTSAWSQCCSAPEYITKTEICLRLTGSWAGNVLLGMQKKTSKKRSRGLLPRAKWITHISTVLWVFQSHDTTWHPILLKSCCLLRTVRRVKGNQSLESTRPPDLYLGRGFLNSRFLTTPKHVLLRTFEGVSEPRKNMGKWSLLQASATTS